MNLIKTIEELDTGHFSRRKEILEDKRKMAKDMGFFPLPLSQNDIECFWITLEPNEAHKNKKIKVDGDDLEYQPYIEALKGVAKYYETITS